LEGVGYHSLERRFRASRGEFSEPRVVEVRAKEGFEPGFATDFGAVALGSKLANATIAEARESRGAFVVAFEGEHEREML
jgi:hypothetical protein